MPIAASPKDSFDTLTDPFLKTVIIFTLMINLIDTRQRIFSLWKLVVVCGAALGVGAIRSYMKGEFTAGATHRRIGRRDVRKSERPGAALDLLLPFAAALTLSSKGLARLFYLGCAAVMTVGVLVTLSRGGFLGLIASGAVLLWKLGAAAG